MRSLYIILGGLVLFALFAAATRFFGAGATAFNFNTAAKLFIPVWFILAAVNMGIGVSKGYSFMEELPIFLMIFALPAVVALLVRWKFA